MGHLTTEILSLVTLIGLITISGSTYLIIYSDKIYPYLSKFLSVFERKKLIEKRKHPGNYKIILFGYNRIGYDLLQSFKKLKNKYLVVDYNPETIKELSRQKIPCRYGDVDDEEFLSELNLTETKMVVSTIPEFETSLNLVNAVRQTNKTTILIVVSHNIHEANILYELGATYVIMPHFLGGDHASTMISKNGLDLDKFLDEKERHLKQLKIKKELGYEHPKLEKNILEDYNILTKNLFKKFKVFEE